MYYLTFRRRPRNLLLFNLPHGLSSCLHPWRNLSSRQTKPLLIPITPLQLPCHPDAIAGLANPILLFALTITPVGMPILKRRQVLEELEGLAARLDLCVFPRARGAFGHDLVVDHDGCDGGWETTGYDGWDFAGHDAVAGAAEGEGEEVVEVGLSGGVQQRNCFWGREKELTVGWLLA